MIILGVLLLGVILWTAWDILAFLRTIPSHMPWITARSRDTQQGQAGIWQILEAFVAGLASTHDMIERGYHKYSKAGKAFVLPVLFTGAEIMLPPALLPWIHDQSEQVLSGFEAHREFMRADWTLLHPSIIHEHIFKRAIAVNLTRRLNELEEAIAAEIPFSLGTNVLKSQGEDGWFRVDGYWSWKRSVLQIVSRIYVGDLCRDPGYIHSAASFNQFSMLIAGLIGVVPRLLRPILAPLICLPDQWHHRQSAKKLKPLLKQRLDMVARCDAAGGDMSKAKLPNDLITWAAMDAHEARAAGDAHKTSLDFLAARVSVLNFVSIDSTTITVGNVLFDILANPAEAADGDAASAAVPLWLRLRDEVTQAQASSPDDSRSYLDRLPQLEACLKESFRMGNFIARSSIKMVVQEGGVHVPGVGQIPRGVKIGVPLWGLHHDPELYPEPYRWRMSRWLQDPARKQSAVFGGTLSPVGLQYHPFGIGRHSCPGKFFAMRVVKLLLVHLLLNYDIKLEGEARPSNPWIGVSRGPPLGDLRIRPRASEGVS